MKHLLAQQIQLPNPNVNGAPVTVTGFDSFSFSSLGDIIGKLMPFLFAFAGIGLLLMIIGSGFSMMTGAGDAKKMEMGRQRLTYALVGFVVIFSAYWIVQLFGRMFGLVEIETIFKGN